MWSEGNHRCPSPLLFILAAESLSEPLVAAVSDYKASVMSQSALFRAAVCWAAVLHCDWPWRSAEAAAVVSFQGVLLHLTKSNEESWSPSSRIHSCSRSLRLRATSLSRTTVAPWTTKRLHCLKTHHSDAESDFVWRTTVFFMSLKFQLEMMIEKR